jgi:hypothetical protein
VNLLHRFMFPVGYDANIRDVILRHKDYIGSYKYKIKGCPK